MKLSVITFTPKAIITISSEEIELLIECSRLHYDAVCRSASNDQNFLRSLQNAEENAHGHGHTLTFRELDTLAKISEIGNYLGGEKGQKCFGIQLQLHRVMNEMRAATPSPVAADWEG